LWNTLQSDKSSRFEWQVIWLQILLLSVNAFPGKTYNESLIQNRARRKNKKIGLLGSEPLDENAQEITT
jgi:hypothetical protein